MLSFKSERTYKAGIYFDMKILIYVAVLLFLIHPSYCGENEDFAALKQIYEDGFYSLALNATGAFLERYPKSDFSQDVLLIKGLALVNLKKYAQATDVLEVLKVSGDQRIKEQAYFSLANLYGMSAEEEKAKELYLYLIQNSKDSDISAQSRYSLGLIYFKKRIYDLAVKEWENLFEIENLPQNEKANMIQNIVLAYFKMGRIKDAEEVVNKNLALDTPAAMFFNAEADFLRKNYSQSINKFDTIIESECPEIWKQKSKLGRVWNLLKLNNYKEAQEVLSALEENVLKEIEDELYYLKPYVFYKNSEFSPATRYYQRFLYKFKDSDYTDRAYLELVDCFYNLNKLQQAEKTAAKFFQVREGSLLEDQMRYLLGWVYYKNGDTEKAIKSFEWVAQKSRDVDLKINSLCRVGDLLSEMGRFDEAIIQYDFVLKNHPSSLYAEYAQYQLGVDLLGKDDSDAAILAFRAVLENFPKSSLLEKVHYHLALAYFKKSDFELALDEINSLLNLFPKSEYKDKALLQKAVLLYNLGDYEKVKKLFKDNTAIQKEPYMQFVIGKVYLKTKEFDLARDSYLWLKENIEDPEMLSYLYLQIGELDFYLQRWDSALDSFEAAYGISKKDEVKGQALYWQAWAYFNKEDLNKALEVFALLFSSDDLAEDAKYNTALILKAQGNSVASVKIFKDVIKGGGKFSKQAILKLGYLYLELEQYQDALELYKRLQEAPYDIISAEAGFRIGEIYELQQNLDQAILQYLSLAAIYDPGLSFVKKARLRCAMLLERFERYDEAEKIYNQISSFEGEESIYARERLKQLQELKLRR